MKDPHAGVRSAREPEGRPAGCIRVRRISAPRRTSSRGVGAEVFRSASSGQGWQTIATAAPRTSDSAVALPDGRLCHVGSRELRGAVDSLRRHHGADSWERATGDARTRKFSARR